MASRVSGLELRYGDGTASSWTWTGLKLFLQDLYNWYQVKLLYKSFARSGTIIEYYCL